MAPTFFMLLYSILIGRTRTGSFLRLLALAFLSVLFLHGMMPVRSVEAETAGSFKVGERLTYTVGFEKFSNVAYAELHTVSRGKIGDVEAVELKARVKTLDFLSAAFYLVDEARVIFASPETGVPLYINKTRYVGGLPKESIQNNLNAPTGNFDLVTMIYKIRFSDSSGRGSSSSSPDLKAGGRFSVRHRFLSAPGHRYPPVSPSLSFHHASAALRR